MAFIADPVKLRTYDEERGYELVYVRSDKEGNYYFDLRGPEGSYYFFAVSYLETLSEADIARLGHDFGGNYMLWHICRWDEPWKPMIAEAMLAYGFSHGRLSADFPVFVRFSYDEPVIGPYYSPSTKKAAR